MNSFDSFDLIDFHTHVLPGADHGSSSLSTSLSQLSLARDAGIKRVVATPHFYPDRHTVDNFLERRQKAYDELAPHITSDLPEIIIGAEVLVCPGIDRMDGIETLCIKGTNTILLELPFSDFDTSYCDVAYKLRSRGMKIILAHADRYPKENIERMLDAGALIQLNTDSLCTLFRRRHLYDWLDRGLVAALGSDIHDANKKAYKYLSAALERIRPFVPQIMQSSEELLKSN